MILSYKFIQRIQSVCGVLGYHHQIFKSHGLFKSDHLAPLPKSHLISLDSDLRYITPCHFDTKVLQSQSCFFSLPFGLDSTVAFFIYLFVITFPSVVFLFSFLFILAFCPLWFSTSILSNHGCLRSF